MYVCIIGVGQCLCVRYGYSIHQYLRKVLKLLSKTGEM